MIELRFIEREIMIPVPQCGEGVVQPKIIKILQQRIQSIHYDGGNHPTGYLWSDWHDVPTVEDDNADI